MRCFKSNLSCEVAAGVLAVASLALLPAAASAQEMDAGPGRVVSTEGAASSAGAATSPDDSGDIVVTARRVAESAQDVPVSLTVLSAESLAARRIVDGYSLQGQVPSLTVSSNGQTRDAMAFTLRGLGQNFSTSPSVVVYANDVPLISGVTRTLNGPVGMFFDLQSVQVLNGPQGTLFGRNTTGGAVILTPARPTDNAEGYIQLEAGNYRDVGLEAVANLPVNDTLALRLSGKIHSRRGFTRDIITGRDYDNQNYQIGRFSALWKPTDRIENLIVGYYSDSRSHGGGDIGLAYNVAAIDRRLAASGGCVGRGLGVNCSVLTDYLARRSALGPRYTALNAEGMSNNSVVGWGVTDKASFEITDTLTINNIASFSRLRARTFRDSDGSPFPFNGAPARYISGYPDAHQQITEELQIQGQSGNKKLQYTAGIYIEQVKTDRPNKNVTTTNLSPVERVTIALADKKSYGLYGQGTIDFGVIAPALDGLRLTAGLRYTKDDYDFTNTAYTTLGENAPITSCSNGISAPPQVASDCAVDVVYKKNVVTWTGGLDYKITPDVLAYAKVSRGYKSGGAHYNAVQLANTTYEPEFVTSYEAGIKTSFRFAEVRGTFNAAAYRNDNRGLQKVAGDRNPVTGASGSAVYNVGKAVIQGIETELALRYEGLSLSGNFSYTDAEHKDYRINNPFGQVDCSRSVVVGTADLTCLDMSGVAEIQYSITGSYTLPFDSEIGEINFSATYGYTGPRFVGQTTLPDLEPGSQFSGFGLLTLSATWSSVGGSNIDLRAFMTNATDKTYRIGNSNVYSTANYQSATYGEPRMYGLQTKFRF